MVTEKLHNRRRAYYAVIDTETANGIVLPNGKLDLTQSLVYDIGWQIIDKAGKVYVRKSYCVEEIFLWEALLMQSAYYADKLPKYWQDISLGLRTLKSLYTIRRDFLADCGEYNIKAVIAHNAPFDVNALNNTIRWVTKSRVRYFLPYGVPVWCTMQMCLSTYAKEKGYQHFCQENGYMTKHRTPRPRVTAEIVYRYITGNNEFEESHTGLEDVEIESEIFAACMRKHKPMRREAFQKRYARICSRDFHFVGWAGGKRFMEL